MFGGTEGTMHLVTMVIDTGHFRRVGAKEGAAGLHAGGVGAPEIGALDVGVQIQLVVDAAGQLLRAEIDVELGRSAGGVVAQTVGVQGRAAIGGGAAGGNVGGFLAEIVVVLPIHVGVLHVLLDVAVAGIFEFVAVVKLGIPVGAVDFLFVAAPAQVIVHAVNLYLAEVIAAQLAGGGGAAQFALNLTHGQSQATVGGGRWGGRWGSGRGSGGRWGGGGARSGRWGCRWPRAGGGRWFGLVVFVFRTTGTQNQSHGSGQQ